MKKTYKKIAGLLALSFIFIFFVFVPIADAQESPDTYTLLAPIPCVGGEGSCSNPGVTETSFEKYIPGIFNLAIGFSAAFAVLNLVWGGFQYLSTDAIQKKSEGRGRLMHSIQGLVLVIAAWLILNTINPDLLNINITLETLTTSNPYGNAGTISTGSYGPGTPISGQQLEEDKVVRDRLKTALGKDSINADPCVGNQTTNCTNLNGLPVQAQDGLINLKSLCGSSCNIVITGATEAGHTTHGVGKAIVDIRDNNTALSEYIIKNGGTPVKNKRGWPIYTVNINGQTATFMRETDPAHWHVEFK